MLYRHIKKNLPLIFFLIATSFSFASSTPLEEEIPPSSFEVAVAEPQPSVQKTEPVEKTPEIGPMLPPPQVETEESQNIHAVTETYETAFIKTGVALVGLLVLIIITVLMFKKISHGRLRSFNYMKSIKILEKRPLSPKSMLYLIEVGGKQILIAESQLEVRTLTNLDWITDKDL